LALDLCFREFHGVFCVFLLYEKKGLVLCWHVYV
jgi:hypothetical protein